MQISMSDAFLALLIISGQCCFSVVGSSSSGHKGTSCWYNSEVTSKCQGCSHVLLLNVSFVFLEALKRSRKRVRNALRTELPYLISSEFSSNQENESSIANTSEAGCADKAVSEAHAARWKSLFVQMDRALQEEAKQLVSLLIGVICYLGKDYM